MARPRFDPRLPLVAAVAMTYAGKQLKRGDPFPTEGIAAHKLKILYSSRRVDHGEAAPADPFAPIGIESTPGGWYNLTAPWLDEPERIRGKVKAERRAAQLRDEGEPDYHHGVRVEEGENGWWSVQADWMGDNAYNIHGEQAAREQAAQLRSEGPPPDPRTDVTVTEEEDGTFTVNAPWLEEATAFDTRESADAHADNIREAGPPEGWEPVAPTE